MRILYRPAVNRTLRSLLKPFSGWIPGRYRFPVTGVIKVRLPQGKEIRLASNPTSYVAKMLFWEGPQGYEYNVFRVLSELVKDADTFIDVGANIGYYSVVAATCNPGLQVVSFEPLPSAYHYLRKNVYLNHLVNVTPLQMAVSDSVGSLRFFASRNPKFPYVEHHLTGTGSLDREQASLTHLLDSIDVDSVTLDHYTKRHGFPKVDLMKIDVEANEHRVLSGAERILSRDRPIVFCEVLSNRVEGEIEDIFRRHGYLMFRVEARHLVPVQRLAHDLSTENDHVMVHPEVYHKIEPFVGSSSGT